MRKGLEGRQLRQEMEIFIRDFIYDQDCSPSLYDIAEKFDMNVGTARWHVLKLAKQGRIHYTPRVTRGIRLVHNRRY